MSRRFPKGTRNPDKCRHRWQPVAFETTSTGHDPTTGRTWDIGQPDLEHARVWLVCVRCASHTYMETAWAGVQLEGSLFRKPGRWEYHELRDAIAKRQADEAETETTP